MINLNRIKSVLLAWIIIPNMILASISHDKKFQSNSIPKLDNQISIGFLQENLNKSHPRLVMNPLIRDSLKNKIKTDAVVRNMYESIKLNANQIYDEPLLKRELTGRRLLWISRDLLYRMNMLGMVYSMEKDPNALNRINNELLEVCKFSDWNPSHFLDVAEMALAVAIGLDWTYNDLPKETVNIVEQALIEKGIQPSWTNDGKSADWAKLNNNWNQVCNGGMIAASLMIAERDPELAVKTISRALDGLPYSLFEYLPDGVYPEGSTYWEYGTSFSVITVAMLESALNSDFGHINYPGFKESAVFRVLSNAPSGWYYNFADCDDKRSENGDITLAWFAAKTGNKVFFEKERFLMPPERMKKLSRMDGAGLVWLSQYKENNMSEVPISWKGDGINPIVIFKGEDDDQHNYYFGGKGGSGSISHGNMDAGSFVFELNGVRWGVDPGNQDYNDLEIAGFDLWDNCQNCERWTLLTKSNYGHSTITVNNELHKVDGKATIIEFDDSTKPYTVFNLTPTFEGLLAKAHRKFTKDSSVSLLIEDDIEIIDSTKLITWQFMTTSDVEIVKEGAILTQDGKQLKIENISHPNLLMSVISLDPPPLKLDRQIKELKRIELRIPVWALEKKTTKIKIRLVEN